MLCILAVKRWSNTNAWSTSMLSRSISHIKHHVDNKNLPLHLKEYPWLETSQHPLKHYQLRSYCSCHASTKMHSDKDTFYKNLLSIKVWQDKLQGTDLPKRSSDQSLLLTKSLYTRTPYFKKKCSVFLHSPYRELIK